MVGLHKLRKLARFRQKWARWIVLLPVCLVVFADAANRMSRLLNLSSVHKSSYVAATIESGVLWGLLLFAASFRRGWFRWCASILFVVLATVSMGCQIYFLKQYATYINLDATLFGTSLPKSLLGQLQSDSKNFFVSIIPPLVITIALVVVARKWLRPKNNLRNKYLRFLVPIPVIAVFLIPCSYRTVQASTPDVIYFHAMGGLAKELMKVRTTAQIKPGLRTVPVLPKTTYQSHRDEPRNVVFLLTESLRWDDSCSVYSEHCLNTPRMNQAALNRIPMLQMRSNTSSTASELAVLWSGLSPTESREALHSAPLLFDYAHAAGMETAYWTSHHMMFGNSRLWVQDLPTKFKCGATDLDPLADIDLGASDGLLVDRVEREIVQLKEPFFAVVHFGNTHMPYWVDPSDSPFQPSSPSRAPEDNGTYHNYYRNAVYLQDKSIGKMIQFIRNQPFGDRTMLVFTSDHGEAFREHDQICHTGSIYDEEIHVPAWFDLPKQFSKEREQLQSQQSKFTFHTDVAPTVLDFLGLWKIPEWEKYQNRMIGQSLLQSDAERQIQPITNCTGVWGCAFKNWGAMLGSRKLLAREWDSDWLCVDVLRDPNERNPLPLSECNDLKIWSDRTYGGPPSLVNAQTQ